MIQIAFLSFRYRLNSSSHRREASDPNLHHSLKRMKTS
jgi:hypothetical protein